MTDTTQATATPTTDLYPELMALDPVLTAAEVAAFLKCSATHVRSLVRQGALHKLPAGHVVLIPRHEVLRFLTAAETTK